MNNLQTDGKFYKHLFPPWKWFEVLFVCNIDHSLGSTCFREVILNSLFELLCLHWNANTTLYWMSINSSEITLLAGTDWLHHSYDTQGNIKDAAHSLVQTNRRRQLSHNTNKVFQTELFRQASNMLKIVFAEAFNSTFFRWDTSHYIMAILLLNTFSLPESGCKALT